MFFSQWTWQLPWDGISSTRLWNSLLAQHEWQAFACHSSCARGLSVAFKNSGNSHQSSEFIFHCDWGNPNLYFDKPITLANRRLCLIPPDRPIATRLWLCNSLTSTAWWSRPTLHASSPHSHPELPQPGLTANHSSCYMGCWSRLYLQSCDVTGWLSGRREGASSGTNGKSH